VYGIGDFGVSSFEIWCRGLGRGLRPKDRALAGYCDWLRSQPLLRKAGPEAEAAAEAGPKEAGSSSPAQGGLHAGPRDAKVVEVKIEIKTEEAGVVAAAPAAPAKRGCSEFAVKPEED